jgi:NitT/TauT family transport system substrate-binding protein
MKRHLILLTIAVSSLAISACFFACDRTDKKAAGSPEKITIANIIPPFTVLVDVAELQSYYKQEGLSVTMQKYQYGQVALQALLEGKADFATVAETPIMLAIMKGEKLSIIATILTSNKNIAIVIRKGKGINTPHDLKGKKIAATFGTIGEFYMDVFLAVNGISRSEMKVVNLKPEAMPGALANGDVDAVSLWTPPLLDVQKKLGDRGLTFHNEDIFTQTMNIVAKQEYIHANPEKVNKLLRALLRAEEFARRNPEEAQKNVAEFNHMDVEMVRMMWGDNSFGVSLDQKLILALEDESQWAIKNRLTKARKIPNYLDFIYIEGLKSVKPEAVRILR